MMPKKKILFISDFPLATSGVGVQSRYLIDGLLKTGKYQFYCLGGALKHENLDLIKVNDDLLIKPINGFGDKNMIMQLLIQLKPNVLFLFTDPRFFGHIWSCEDMIHQYCPIVFNTIWDNGPCPVFNSPLYKSCDLLNCINEVAFDFTSQLCPELKEMGQINYIPHGVPQEVFHPIPEHEAQAWKVKFLGEQRRDHMVGLYVSRNARRKMPSDVIYSWKLFLDELEQKHGHRKATLIMHTDPFDMEGPNLHAVIELFKLEDNVIFSKDRASFENMRTLYNVADFVVNASCAEGFGLSLLEAKMCGKPGVAIMTGGLTRQIKDHQTGFEYGVAIKPEVKTLVGNQQIPYIYEDTASHETYAAAYMKMYDMGAEGRKALGQQAMLHARLQYNVDDMVRKWDETLTKTMDMWDMGMLPNNKRYEVTTL